MSAPTPISDERSGSDPKKQVSAPQSPDLTPPPDLPVASASAESNNAEEVEGMIDPDLANLPAPPPNPSSRASPSANGQTSTLASFAEAAAAGASADGASGGEGPKVTLGLTESIASAPNPRHTDFTPPNFDNEEKEGGNDEMDLPGSPTSKAMRLIAPPNAMMPDPKWPAPPPNASVNLFIGRALLSHGNDNWPLKPNEIVNWIRKHYPAEWDGDEGRCSAHRVRTYLARKGADMYYEKLNQGSIAGWRIRQNHLWRFENGGFQGRGMKQEEAIAQAQKESEAAVTAAHKLAAAEALAQGHPGIKVSMSAPGVSDGAPPQKRPRIKGQAQTRRKSTKKNAIDASPLGNGMHGGDEHGDQSFYQATAGQDFGVGDASGAGPSAHHEPTHADEINLDPMLIAAAAGHSSNEDGVDINMVHQAMQAAAAANAGQIDELDMGIELPIEMQMHGEGDGDEERYRGTETFYGTTGEGTYGTGGTGYGYGEGQQVYGGYQQGS